MKKLKAFMRNKEGSSYLFGLLITLGVVVLFYCLFCYQTAVANVKRAQDSGQLALDAYTVQTGKLIVDQIKNGSDYTDILRRQLFLEDYYTILELDSDFKGWYPDGTLRYEIKEIKTDFVVSENLKTKVTYTMSLPFYFFKLKVFTQEIPITLESHYNLKT